MMGLLGLQGPLPMTPKGAANGVYTIAQTGNPRTFAGVAAAAKYVGDHGGTTLLLEDQVFGPPDWTSATAVGSLRTLVNWDTRVDVKGRGSLWSGIRCRGSQVADSSLITGTNPFWVTVLNGGSGRTHQGYGVDGGNRGAYTVSLSLKSWRNCTNLTVIDVPGLGGRGTKNIPPEETHFDNFYTCAGYRYLNTWQNGMGLSATIVSTNHGSGAQVSKGAVYNSGAGHGYSSYDAGDISYTDTDSRNIGTGSGGQAGACYNHEETRGAIRHNRSSAAAGSIASARFEAGGAYGSVDNPDIILTDVNWAGGNYGYRLEQSQLTPPQVVRGSIAGINGLVEYKPDANVTYRVAGGVASGIAPPTTQNAAAVALTANGRTYSPPGGAAVYDQWTFDSTNLGLSIVFRTPATAPTQTVRFVDLLDAPASAGLLRVLFLAGGKLAITDASGATMFTSSAALQAGVEYTLQIYVTANGGGAATLNVDYYLGDQVTTTVEAGLASTTASTGTVDFGRIRIGQVVSNSWAGSFSLRKIGMHTNAQGYVGRVPDPS